MSLFIDFWKLQTENSILHVFILFHKLSFENNFCFLSILGCQTSFLVSKLENCFWKQKIRGKIVTKHTLSFPSSSRDKHRPHFFSFTLTFTQSLSCASGFTLSTFLCLCPLLFSLYVTVPLPSASMNICSAESATNVE